MFTLYYVHDPMCSWCYGFAPVYDRLVASLPEELGLKRIVGGLAPDSDAPMPAETREYVQRQWRRIEEMIPGRKFNCDFWTQCRPRRSTYPACRAVIAARAQGEGADLAMSRAIQSAYYDQARNPSDVDTLVELGGEIGLDGDRLAGAMASEAVAEQLRQELTYARELGVRGFPSLVLHDGNDHRLITINYLDHEPMLAEIRDGMRTLSAE